MYEHLFDRYFRLENNQKTVTFSSMGHNAVVDADITTEAVPLASISPIMNEDLKGLCVLKCTSHLKSVLEDRGSIWSFKFHSSQGLLINVEALAFIVALKQHLVTVKRQACLGRLETFYTPQPILNNAGRRIGELCSTSPYGAEKAFTEKMAAQGLYYFPISLDGGSTVQALTRCSWCQAVVGPFQSVDENIKEKHKQQSEAVALSCPHVYTMN